MTIGTVPVKEVTVVVDAPPHMTKGVVETLSVGHRFRGVSQMPLANVPGGISVVAQEFRQSHFGGGHSRLPLGGGNVSRHPGAGGNATGQQTGAGGRANGGGRIHIGEANSPIRQAVNRRRMQVLRSVTTRIHRPLIIGVNQNYVRFSLSIPERKGQKR